MAKIRLYQIGRLTDVEWRKVESPFGMPSDELCFGRLAGVDVDVVALPCRTWPIVPPAILANRVLHQMPGLNN